ncbi:AAA family ATPase [Brevundimonas sp.]|uniref:AAA family ATPase n=1 Tax=Brevundimonas sp. TaxID=1871086 RepID=UPI0035B0E990
MSNGDSLLEWAGKQHDWAKDALRRHAQSEGHDLDEVDLAAVRARVRFAAGIPHEDTLDHSPLAAEHLNLGATGDTKTLLCSIGPLTNVGRLAADQKLSFALDGVTLIYGDNGSGKSGYCGVTKNICRSLTRDNLLGNVFEAGAKPPATALIRFKSPAEEPIEAPWTNGTPSPAAVRSISVFDSRNARFYVDRDNRIGFLPAEISLLERHAAVRGQLSAEFEVEKKALEAKCKVALPVGYSPGGKLADALGKLILRGKALPTREALLALAEFSDEDAAEVERLTKALAQDPAAVAARLQRAFVIVKAYAELARTMEEGVSETALACLKTRHARAVSAQQAAEFAATDQFSGEPLKGVGTGPWGLMFEHAKAYALSIGLDDLPGATGDPCALCQQPLSADAAERLARFNSFVAGEAAKHAAAAAASLKECLDALTALAVPTPAVLQQSLAEYRTIGKPRAELAARMIDFFAAIDARKHAFAAAASSGDFDAIPALAAALSGDLLVEVEALQGAVDKYNDQAKLDTGRAEDAAKLNELRDRQWLKNALATIDERHADITAHGRVLEAIRLVGTSGVSTQITSIRRKLVTEGLDARIRAEIEALDLGHMPFEVNDHSRDGGSYFEVKLKAEVDAPPNAEILSEGEQRALALACFLAEVGADTVGHGLIFDDPVSSLDHIRLRLVAKRLVAEARKGKQVVIFTHNILFYNEVQNFAAEAGVPLARRLISKANAEGFGVVANDAEPWVAKKITLRIEELRVKAKTLDNYSDKSSDTYRDSAKDFYSSLRETWERLVEEILLNKVVERYTPDVRTQSLKGVVVENTDYKTIYFAMKRASEFSGHDQPAGKQIAIPSPEDMKADITVIHDYLALINKRRKETEELRKAEEQAPKAQTA